MVPRTEAEGSRGSSTKDDALVFPGLAGPCPEWSLTVRRAGGRIGGQGEGKADGPQPAGAKRHFKRDVGTATYGARRASGPGSSKWLPQPLPPLAQVCWRSVNQQSNSLTEDGSWQGRLSKGKEGRRRGGGREEIGGDGLGTDCCMAVPQRQQPPEEEGKQRLALLPTDRERMGNPNSEQAVWAKLQGAERQGEAHSSMWPSHGNHHSLALCQLGMKKGEGAKSGN